MTIYGTFGREVRPEVPSYDVGIDRREKIIETIVGEEVVSVIVRDTIVDWDPYLNMVRATAYMYQTGGGPTVQFPVPPISRELKDVLIKTDLVI
jgi:hypothetical protein